MSIALVAWVGVATPAVAQADTCINAIPVATGIYTGDLSALTSDGSSACTATANDASYKYVAGPNPPLLKS